MIERVEQLQAILHRHTFHDLELFHSGEIEVAGPWAGQDIAAGRAIATHRVDEEGLSREPLGDLGAARTGDQGWLRHDIRQIVADEAARVVHAGTDGERESRLPVPDAGSLPSAEGMPQSAGGRRDLPNVVQDEAV